MKKSFLPVIPANAGIIVLCVAALFFLPTPSARAALFGGDDEARKAILELRKKLDDLSARVEGKADKTNSLTLADQNEHLSEDIAKLRGQIEVLSHDLTTTQQRQKDFYTDIDTRLRKLEPKKVNVDGQEVSIDPHEQQSYDAATTLLKAGDYKGASTSFVEYLRRYPHSGYAPSALYSLGIAYYAQRDYKNAITTNERLVKQYPDNPKAPDALLSMSASYTELKDAANAKKTLDQLIEQYPNTPAATTAKGRLDATKTTTNTNTKSVTSPAK